MMERNLLKTRKLARNISLAALLMAAPAVVSAFTFTTCGATGPDGPLQAACDADYTGTDLDGLVTVAAGIQSWTVPATGLYRIETQGAQGASGDINFVGGLGAQIIGEYSLTAGSVIQVVVGQQGTGQSSGLNGGGGGGSFVVDVANTPIQIAGGGGGTRTGAAQNGCDASITEFAITGSGSANTSTCTVKAIDLGLGGRISSSSWGSAGAGFNGDGATDIVIGADGGSSWANGMSGGDASAGSPDHGGFGGGGTGNGSLGGGGGGGYSGGDGGWIAGGGGSYNTGANPVANAAVSSGDGTVIIDALFALPSATPTAVPTLSQWAQGMLILLLLASAVLFRRKSSRS